MFLCLLLMHWYSGPGLDRGARTGHTPGKDKSKRLVKARMKFQKTEMRTCAGWSSLSSRKRTIMIGGLPLFGAWDDAEVVQK